MPKANPPLTFRLEPADAVHLAVIVEALRRATGAVFVTKTEAMRAALKAAAQGRSVAEVIAR